MTVVTTPQFYLLLIGAPLDPPKLVPNLLSFVTQRFSHLYKKEIRDGKDGKIPAALSPLTLTRSHLLSLSSFEDPGDMDRARESNSVVG